MKLAQARDLIEHGRTARLRQWRGILHWYIIKEHGWYVKQAEGYTNPRGVIVVPTETAFYLCWDALMNASGSDALSDGWEITDDRLASYQMPAASCHDGA